MRRFLQAIFVVVALMSSGVRASADDAQALLDKNKAFAGWAFGDPSMMSLRMTGTIAKQQVTDLRRGAVFRRTTVNEKSGLSYALGYTGKVFWYSNENGFTVPLMGETVGYDIAYQIVMNQGIPELKGTLHGKATIDGVPTQIVRLTPQNADAIDAYIDPSSGKLVRAVIDPDRSARTIDVLGYADVGGKKVISKWRNGEVNCDFPSVTNGPISDQELHPPAPTAYWTFGQPAPIPITITPYRIVIRAAINGVPGNFLLDSGASIIALNSDFADRLHLKEVAKNAMYGITGVVHSTLARADTVAVGPNVLHNVVVSVGINVHGRHEDYDGLLGFDFLAGAIIDVDMAGQKLTIYDPQKFAVTAQGPEVVADLSRGVPSVSATFNGRVKAHLVLDTGNSMAVYATDKLYGPGKVEMRFEGYSRPSGVSGDSAKLIACGHTNSIEMGPLHYENVPVCFSPYFGGKDGGLIGFDFLKHFDLTFDYPESALYLTPLAK